MMIITEKRIMPISTASSFELMFLIITLSRVNNVSVNLRLASQYLKDVRQQGLLGLKAQSSCSNGRNRP